MKRTPVRSVLNFCLPALLLAATPLAAQEEKVEYVPTRLSDTVTMVKGRGGNIAVSAGDEVVAVARRAAQRAREAANEYVAVARADVDAGRRRDGLDRRPASCRRESRWSRARTSPSSRTCARP